MSEDQYGPLGPGHAPTKDPMKSFNGVVAGTLILEAITIFLALTVILKIDNGALWTTFNWVSITALGAAHFVLAFLTRFKWALPVAIFLQVLLLAGFFIHWSVGAIGVMFGLVWWFVLHLRRNMIERMRRGLLVTQHLG
ncbi:DUF4233 domain-containing protein [Corynebacterium breve]|uniref:DUF4233 domain-containing protein n=1 Tax=Corynebacterium breve TaxID=3049799 RepID=A0ABY8VHC4_9CORY|nr:DUF4233 domain-containing protein [Corynebacterium breve]WIM69054.1 DUF4233 domain-containing protein [Corynebacterium breve]